MHNPKLPNIRMVLLPTVYIEEMKTKNNYDIKLLEYVRYCISYCNIYMPSIYVSFVFLYILLKVY